MGNGIHNILETTILIEVPGKYSFIICDLLTEYRELYIWISTGSNSTSGIIKIHVQHNVFLYIISFLTKQCFQRIKANII
ncbi:hypothetical protein ECANGB1_1074 [Enterospora canceri]|uniref:Uncharacterized protein n=1 Tax=Enterospora canceri TaxID=1081671 RepID=A0A1Y1S7J8_9MICR|nr:hypothetical protein ECANGB1_1074 [Enterospora canceri]